MKRTIRRTTAIAAVVLCGIVVGTLHESTPEVHAGDPRVPSAVVNGDVNCDGGIDMGDTIYMINWLFRGGDRPCSIVNSPRVVQSIAELEAELERTNAFLWDTERVLFDTEATLEETQANLQQCNTDLTGRGCTDPEAMNYDVCAWVEDGSCQYPGCTNSDADNYDPRANVEDGSCLYSGCTDSAADNYDPRANVEDDSCEYLGCTDPDADNYDSDANVDDGNCEFRGCTDPDARNYDSTANVNDGSCEYDPPAPDGFTSLGANPQGYFEYRHEQTGGVFVRLPGGEFDMGSPEDELDRHAPEGPVHTVTLSPFLIGKFELTQARWEAVMGSNPSRFKGDDRRPVERVTWEDIQVFEAETGLSAPSEAQWEYACRAGQAGPFSGTGNLDDVAWYGNHNGGMTHAVGTKQANQFGLYDMHGNVREWCEDVYDAGFYESEAAGGPDPVSHGDSGDQVVRGGSWWNSAIDCRSAYRGRAHSGLRSSTLGFRPIRSLP